MKIKTIVDNYLKFSNPVMIKCGDISVSAGRVYGDIKYSGGNKILNALDILYIDITAIDIVDDCLICQVDNSDENIKLFIEYIRAGFEYD